MPQRLVPPSLLDRLGRRDACLAVLGFALIVAGGFILLARSREPGHAVDWGAVPHEAIPFPLLGLAWIVAGLIALVVGWRHSPEDHLGFMAAVAPPMLMTASYVVSALTWVCSLGAYGVASSFLGALAWGAVVLLIGIIASWPESGDAVTDST